MEGVGYPYFTILNTPTSWPPYATPRYICNSQLSMLLLLLLMELVETHHELPSPTKRAQSSKFFTSSHCETLRLHQKIYSLVKGGFTLMPGWSQDQAWEKNYYI